MIEILLLGPLQIQNDGEPIPNLALNKVQALLAYLVAESPRVHRREALAALLWPDYTESSARVNLRQTLKRLRQALPVDAILATRQTVGIHPEFVYMLDLVEFTELLENHRRTSSMESLKQAAQRYRGDFLEQLWVEDSAAFEEWVLLKREWLRREMLDALNQLAAHALGENYLDEAAYFARRQIELDLLNERAYQQLMQALAQGGRRVEALQEFEACRRVLRDELDCDPSRSTVVLAKQIRSGGIGQQGEAQTTPRPQPAQPRLLHNLPYQGTPIVGREEEIAALNRLFADENSRLITIMGPGGIGKTRLALTILQQIVERRQEDLLNAPASRQRSQRSGLGEEISGVYFVPLQAVSEAQAIAPAIADAIDLHFASNYTPQHQLANYLKQKKMLLLLDNFEQLLGGTDLLVELLQTCPNLRLLVTSRERLNLHREQLFVLNGLAYPHESMQRADAYPAVRLFLQTAQRIRHDFEMDDEALSHITNICQRVEGMPLALELAASWVSILPLPEIARTVINSMKTLSSTARDLPDRHRSMRAVFDITWQQMNEEEQTLFANLSIFRGGFTRDAATQVTDATMPQLADLVNKSLIRYEPAEDRYHLHELLRQYGEEKMQQSVGAEAQARDQHSDFYCTWLAAKEQQLESMNRPIIQTSFSVEYENICQAWEWAVSHKQVARLQHVVSSFGLLMMRMARYHEGMVRFEEALRQLEPPDSDHAIDAVHYYVYARILICCGDHIHFLGDGAKAKSMLDHALEILRGPISQMLDTRLAQAAALNCIGDTTFGEEGRDYYQQSLDLARLVNDRWHEARVLLSLSELLGLENLASAETVNELAQQSLDIHREVGDLSGVAWNLETIGEFAVNRGNVAAGRRAIDESMQIRQRLNLQFGIARCHSKLGHLGLVAGENEDASQHLKQAVEIWTELSLTNAAARDLCFLAAPMLHAGDYQAVHATVMRALQLLQDDQTLHEVIDRAHRMLGLHALAIGKNRVALEKLKSSAENTVFRAPKAYSLCGLALAEYRLNSIANARQALGEALQIACESDNYFLALQALNAATLLLVDAGDVDYARKLHTSQMKHPFNANSRWVADVIVAPFEQAIHAAKPHHIHAPQDEESQQWVSQTRNQCQALSVIMQIDMLNRY